MARQQSTAIEVSAPGVGKEIERVLIRGDLSGLTEEQCVDYYLTTCKSLGLNPLTKPFSYLILNGKKVLYANKDCTEQLRKIHGISVSDLIESIHEGVFIVKAKGIDKSGRTDASTGAVTVTGLRGDALANAMMKAETKAKRRFTLSICGLGMLDETEVETIPGAKIEGVKLETNLQLLPGAEAAEAAGKPLAVSTETKAPATAKPAPAARPALAPKTTAPPAARPAPAAKPVPTAAPPAQPKPEPATPPANPTKRSTRAAKIANASGTSTTAIMTCICRHLGCTPETIGQKQGDGDRLDAMLGSLESCLGKFPASLVSVLITEKGEVDSAVKTHFLGTYASLIEGK